MANINKQINYTSRDFLGIKGELITFIQRYYPDILQDFSDASIGSLFLDLMASSIDILSFHTDRVFNETQLEYAQQRKSLLSLARTYGLKVPGKRPSISLVDFTVTVPTLADTFDVSYCPTLRQGSQVQGGGQIFEVVDDVDFTSPFTTGGVPNRTIIPNINQSGQIVSYNITKRELVVAGTTRIFRRVLRDTDVIPFFELTLPEQNVLSIEQIITLQGTNLTSTPTIDDFLNQNYRWWEVDSLAEDKVFIEDTTRQSDSPNIKPGKFIRVTQKFIKEYTDLGFCKVIFGSGTGNDYIGDFINSGFQQRIGDFLNNISLGEIPPAGNTLYVRYRIGGGSLSNVGANVLTSLGQINFLINGQNQTINNSVRNSLSVNNPIPAIGGVDEPSIEQIRKLIAWNFSSQNRCVTIRDYLTQIYKIPSRFGLPYKVGVKEEQNKILIFMLGLDSNGKLNNTSTNTLKENISEYLSDYRMINDYILINDGKILNIGVDVDLYTDKSNQSEIILTAINKINNFFSTTKYEMGENIFLGGLIEELNNINGVLNVLGIRIFAKVGGSYSINESSQPYKDNVTKEIDVSDFTLFGEPNSLYEVKFLKDISIRVKN
jgi:hypothetical protein